MIGKNYSADFQKTRWKGGKWAAENSLDVGCNPDHVTLRLLVQFGYW